MKEIQRIARNYIEHRYMPRNWTTENQDGGIGRHTVPPRTTRTDRGSNSREVRHQVDKKETYIQTDRRGRDRHWGGEDSRGRGGTETGRVWDEQGRQSDHWQTLQPNIRAQINQEGQSQSGREWGRQCGG